ncbi:MAG: AAA family ATPase, partial [Actinomycetota bacterium]|nr:AAA family ATPase [Actinomycetota bacterium]
GRGQVTAGEPAHAVAALERALSLWRGPPLAELAYEPFAQREIARLDDLRVAAAEGLIEAKLALGGHAEVVQQLEALIAEHPYREGLRAQLMLALYRSDRQAEALQAYQGARGALVEELGIEPGERLRELERAILAQDPGLHLPVSQDSAAAEPAAQVPHPMLVGRERELAELVAGLDDAVAGRGRLFLLGGEPGIGKSRLAEQLSIRARERGVRVLVGRCWEAGGAPAYWPWIQALRAYLREGVPDSLRSQLGRGGPDLVTILPELREFLPDLPPPQAPASEGARFELFDAVAGFIRNAASIEPLAVVLDDLHAGDASSLLLLRFVAGELADAPILIVGCYRDTEVGGDLAQTLAELSRHAGTRRLALKGLGGADTARLLELTMGDAPADQLAERIHAETDGNPLFAAEIGRLLGQAGAPAHTEGRLPIPEGVREAIGLRLQRQSENCTEVLRLASVIGREFGVDALERASGLPEPDLFAALDEAAAARLIGDAPGTSGRLRFSHILVRDALYEALPAPGRLKLHRTVAETLEALYVRDPDPHLAELAHHYVQAGSLVAEKAVDYAQRAGDQAAAQYAYEEAARQYRRALRMLETSGAAGADSGCEVLLSLGDVLSRAGSDQDAKQALQQAAKLAESAGRSDQLARAALAYGGRFAWGRASIDPALVPLLERALAAVGEGDGQARAKLLARLAGATRDDLLRDRRVRLAQEAVEIATRCGDLETLAFALEGQYIALEGPQLIAGGEGVELGAKLVSLGEQIGDKERVFAGHDHRVHSLWMLGDRAGVETELDALSALADELRQPANHWEVGTGQTMLALMEGRFERAEQLIQETLALGQQAQSWNAIVTQRLALFVLRRAQGRLAELEETIRRSVHEYPALLRFRCALAHLYAELGRERDARAAFEALLSRDLGHEHVDAEWLFSMALLTDPCAFLGDERAAAKLYTLLVPYAQLYAQAPVEAVFGSMARGLGVLATTLRRFDDAERHFEAALELEHRMSARPWLAHTQHDLATLLLARAETGDRFRARELLAEATRTYRVLGMEAWAVRATALGRQSGP